MAFSNITTSIKSVKEGNTNKIRRKYVKKEGISSSSSECESTSEKKRIICKSTLLPNTTTCITKTNYLCHKQRCLAESFQEHAYQIVNLIPFEDSDIPDNLLQDECLTEDECKQMRETKDRKTQIRNLVPLLKGRTYKVMNNFLDVIKAHNEELANSVHNSYNKRLNDKENIQNIPCVVYKLKNDVNIKYVIDILYSKKLISDPLYNRVANCKTGTGEQSELWEELLLKCNGRIGTTALCQALSMNDHYTHIAKGLERMYNDFQRPVTCTCQMSAPVYRTVHGELESDNTSNYPESCYSESDNNMSDNEICQTVEVDGIDKLDRDKNILPKSHNTFEPPRKNNSTVPRQGKFKSSSRFWIFFVPWKCVHQQISEENEVTEDQYENR